MAAYSDREARLLESYLEELIAVGKTYRGILRDRHHTTRHQPASIKSEGDESGCAETEASDDFAAHATARRARMRGVLEDEIDRVRRNLDEDDRALRPSPW
mmetsp:Transcript_26983/g.107980  ORF Transcript_26983/g.107980 Transcript_26983/m.107980 type:complete len:101 (+) Transcript_26983:1021-1323(+)